MDAETKPGRPVPAGLYIALNIALWLGLFFVFLPSASPAGRILLIAGLAVALMVTVSTQVILHFTLSNQDRHPVRRALLFFLPAAVVLGILLTLPARVNPPNQQNLLASPDGTYRLVMSIQPGPAGGPGMAWVLGIEDAAGRPVYTDRHSPFDATETTVFWLWDDQNRVWLFSRSDQSTWYWEPDGDTWTRKQHQAGDEPAPPEGLRP